MSLIDEALKRAQSAAQGEPAPPADRPWVPTPMPDAGLRRGSRARRAVGAVLLLIAAAGAVYLLKRRPAEVSASPSRVAAHSMTPAVGGPAAAVPTPFPVLEVPTPPRARAQTAAEPPPPAAKPEVQAEAAAPPRSRLVSGKTYSGVIELHEGARIELGGIVWSETEPRALVNDRVVGVGAYVEGFTVSRIETDRVELEKDGVKIFLAVP